MGTLKLRPLSARSAVLSLLLGAHPPELPVRELVRAAEDFGIADQTLRVALTRMVAAGDLQRTDATYRLSERLIERQHRQDEAVEPATRAWHGQWEFVVITAIGRSSADRAELRSDLARLRLAELREGVWVRPANLKRDWPDTLGPLVQRFTGKPDGDPDALAAQLWDLPAWSETGRALLDAFNASVGEPAQRFTIAAAIVRHLLSDPILPPPLVPDTWPADELRAAYSAYRDELAAIRHPSR